MGADEQQSYGALESSNQRTLLFSKPPPRALVHGALLVVFSAFGAGSFVSKFGIHGASPLMFELLREACTGPPFLLIALFLRGRALPDACDTLRVLLICTLFASAQACFFLGLKHENPTVGSTWQVALPAMTTTMAVLGGLEQASCQKASGIFLASGGAAWMTLGAMAETATAFASKGRASRISGHALFFGQCVLNSAYIVLSKPMAKKYGSFSVTGWVFTLGSLIFLVCAVIAKSSWGLSWFICEDIRREVTVTCIESILAIPASMVWPLLYEIVFCSFIAWHLLTWSLIHAKASMVSIYTVVQPCTTCVLSLMVIGLKGRGWAQSYGITTPGLHNILGAILIGAGLSVMFSGDAGAAESEEQRISGNKGRLGP